MNRPTTIPRESQAHSPAEVNSLHSKAMDFADRALRLQMDDHESDAAKLFRKAYEREREAALAVVHMGGGEPSRSILLRSAAALALDCDEVREAERLISLALAGDPPPEIIEELRDLLESVHFQRHLDLRGIRLAPTELQLTLDGAAVGNGVMESSQFLKRAETFCSLIMRTADRKGGSEFRESGPRNLRGFGVYFSAARPASYAITVKMTQPKGQMLLPLSELPNEAVILDEVLTCIELFAQEQVQSLRDRIKDEAYFNNFTALAKKLAPDGQKVRLVGLTTTKGRRQRSVSMKSPPTTIWSPTPNEGEGERVEYVGRMQLADERDANRPQFKIQSDDGGWSPPIQVKPGLLTEIVKPYWGEEVRVTAFKKSKNLVELLEIVPVDDSQDA